MLTQLARKSSKKYKKKSISRNSDLNYVIGGKDKSKIQMLQIMKHYARKSSKIFTKNIRANDYIGIGWFLTSNEFISERCKISKSSVQRKLRELENTGYIKRDKKYILCSDKKLRQFIKIIYLDKLLNLLKNKDKQNQSKEVKVMKEETKVDHHIYIDNTSTIIINNNSFRKIDIKKKICSIDKRLLSIIENDEKIRSYNNFRLSDIELTNEVCEELRARTSKYYSNSFLNELLKKLSILKPFHTFKDFINFMNYFTIIVKNEKRDWRDTNDVKSYKIPINSNEVDNFNKKNRFIDYLKKKYEEMHTEFDLKKIKYSLYRQKEQNKRIERLKLMLNDSSIENLKCSGILDAIASDFYDKFKCRALQCRFDISRFGIEQVKDYLYGKFTTEAKEFELLTLNDFHF